MKDYKLKINGDDYAVTINDIEDSVAEVEVNGTPFKVEFDKPVVKKAIIAKPAVKAVSIVSKPTAAVSKPAASVPAGGESITSPLPGVILEVCCKEGDVVKKGQKLFVLEAMKMENAIEATTDGKIVSIKVNKGDSILEGALLTIIG